MTYTISFYNSLSELKQVYNLDRFPLKILYMCTSVSSLTAALIPLYNHHGVGCHDITPPVTDWSVVMSSHPILQ